MANSEINSCLYANITIWNMIVLHQIIYWSVLIGRCSSYGFSVSGTSSSLRASQSSNKSKLGASLTRIPSSPPSPTPSRGPTDILWRKLLSQAKLGEVSTNILAAVTPSTSLLVKRRRGEFSGVSPIFLLSELEERRINGYLLRSRL